MDIRTKTGLIIQKGGQYLVGTVLYSTDLRWSIYKWDAWFTRNIDHAQRVAEKVGGEIMLFNPIVGQLRALGGTDEGSHKRPEQHQRPVFGTVDQMQNRRSKIEF